FLAIAAHHMRRILVDHARRRNAGKRGAGAAMVSIDDVNAGTDEQPLEILALDQALDQLAEADPRKARAMELRYFAGLDTAEIAAALNVSAKTVEKDIKIARAWLRAAMRD